MTGSTVASCPVSHVGPSRDGLDWAHPRRSGLSGAREHCLLFVCLRLWPQMCQSISDWCLPSGPDSSCTCSGPRSCRPSAAIDALLGTKSGLNVFGAAALFWRAQGLRSNLLLLLCESCLPAEFIHLCLFFCCRLRGDSGEKKYWRCLIYATYVFVFESELLFNNTTDPLFPGAEEWKGAFSTAGAVIPCCQSSLYCRSCICSFLDLSTEGVVAVFVLTGTIMLLLKPVKKKKNPYIFIHNPVFSSNQRWEKAR